jgi:hypothetical protein
MRTGTFPLPLYAILLANPAALWALWRMGAFRCVRCRQPVDRPRALCPNCTGAVPHLLGRALFPWLMTFRSG